MKSFVTKNIVAIVIAGAAILAVLGAAWYLSTSHAPSFTTTTAISGNVIASLDEPATVAAENDANLSFQAAGQIAHVYVTEGQAVTAGTMLADLGTATLQAAVEQAQAAQATAQAQLDSLKSGTRPEQIAINQNAITNAQSVLSVDIGNAYTSADDAVHNQTDNLFSNAKTNNPTLLVPVTDSQLLNNVQSSRETIEAVLDAWYAAQGSSTSTPASLDALSDNALQQTKAYLDQLALAVNDATPNSNMTAAALAGYKVNIATARTEVGAAITTLTNAESALLAAENALTLAQAGATPQAIEAQEAAVAQAQAAVAASQVALGNATLVAPFAGTVQNLTAQVGQVVSPGVPVASLVNNGGLKIEAYVSETDVAKLKTGDAAQVTLDAFGTATAFPATVTTVGSVETQVNGTPAYLVTLHFTNAEPQIKDGMTGNAHIILAEHDGVVEVPNRLVIQDGNNYFVLVETPAGAVRTQVGIGITGADGMTEITSGVNAGDQLVNF